MLHSPPQAVYLAIGTELTSGQITNRNAAWISKQLEARGIPVSWHLAVPDDRKLMLEAMKLAQKQGSLVFITGGLGPTTDDFTREVVAEWWGSALEWHQPSWERIVERLKRRGLSAPESNKQQAFFPVGARVLQNREGTADGFLLERPELSVVVLPGPPREIDAVWQDHVSGWLNEKYGQFTPIQPLKWQVLGRSESELGEWVEEIVKDTGLITGYRATPPYVEVKIWIPRGRAMEDPVISRALDALDRKLEPWTITRNEEDLLDQFFAAHDGPLTFVDGATRGWLSDRLWTWARSSELRMKIFESRKVEIRQQPPVPAAAAVGFVQGELNSASDSRTTFVLGAIDPYQEFPWGIRKPVPGGSRIEIRGQRCPYQSFLRERQEKYQVEWLFHSALRV
jgi:nicotinamide-nucleotide amidase